MSIDGAVIVAPITPHRQITKSNYFIAIDLPIPQYRICLLSQVFRRYFFT
ncbi:hypothetical protein DDI_0838 [Dickeya dianthicola RNS04.9]|nr:hypothetical protein DDI_0838 [Dickeya dianthicola RNS04.9]